MRVAVVERELVGGECSNWACIPSKTLLRPGEAAHDANEAAASAQVDVAAALAWRDYMVSKHVDTNAAAWLTNQGIDLLRGNGRLAGHGAVEVGGIRYTARHVVVATGSEPIIPPVPGLPELKGVWTNREVTAMEAIPRRLLILGSGPVGVEMAQAVRRLGGDVALVDMAEHVLPREPEALGFALGDVLRRDGIEMVLGVNATAARREGVEFVLELDDDRELRGDRLLVATGRRPRVHDIGLESVAITADDNGIPVDTQLRAGDGIWAIGDVTGIWPLTTTGKYQGDIVAANILGEPRTANYEALPRVVFTDPQAAAVGDSDARFTRQRTGLGGLENRHLHPRVRRVEWLPDPPQRRAAAHRRVRARARSRRMAPTSHVGHPRARTAPDPARHDPTVPYLLRDLQRRVEGTQRRSRGR